MWTSKSPLIFLILLVISYLTSPFLTLFQQQEYWYKAPGNELCDGTTQSPINIGQAVINSSLSAPVLYEGDGCTSWYQFSNNYTFEVAFVEGGNSLCPETHLTYEGSEYKLLQIHFHSPSEHTFSGGYYSAEAHLVHKNVHSNALLVLGVPLEVSAMNIQTMNNTFFQTLWSKGGPLGGLIEDSDVTLLPYSWLVPSRRSFYTYNGSLTTPPCKPNVRWIVFDEPVVMSQSDIHLLRSYAAFYKTNILSAYGNNNRFPQPALNGRTVYYSPSDGQCSTTTNVYSTTSTDDDVNQVATAQHSTSAIVVAAVAILFALIALFGWFQTNQKLTRIEILLRNSMPQQRGVDIEMSENPIKRQ